MPRRVLSSEEVEELEIAHAQVLSDNAELTKRNAYLEAREEILMECVNKFARTEERVALPGWATVALSKLKELESVWLKPWQIRSSV